MTLGNTTREEAALANVIVEMFQAPVSVDREGDRGEGKRTKDEREMGRGGRESIAERFTALFSPLQQ